MAKNKRIKKAERESMNIKDKLLEALKVSTPEVFAEGKVNWDKVRLVLGKHLDASSEKFNFTWAGKVGAVTNVSIPSKTTLRPAEKESVKFDRSENLFIEGDNLEVLKLLQKSYFEQVKMIYIDPPYNTGNDFVYKDDFRQPLKNYLEQSGQVDSEGNRLYTNTQASGRFHSDWLTMMYPRLKLAWNLLRHDGVIFVSIDDNEVHRLRMMMDEIFGEENFVTQFVVIRSEGGGLAKQAVIGHDYVLTYAKQLDKFSPLKRPRDIRGQIIEKDGRKYWIEEDWLRKEFGKYGTCHYEEIEKIKGKQKKKEIDDGIASGLYQLLKKSNGKHIVGRLRAIDEDSSKFYTVLKHLNASGVGDLEALKLADVFSYPKPVSLIKELVLGVTMFTKSDGDIILDFFAGSATTAHAVLAQNQGDGGNRKFIMVQMPEPTDPKSEAYKAGFKTIADIAKERIRRVLKGYGDHKAIDGGFKVFKLGKSNYYDNLFEYDSDKSVEENDKTFKDYLNKAQKELFPAKLNELDIVYENIIKEGLSLNAKIEEVKIGKSTAYKVRDTERELYISLDEKLSASAIEVLTYKEYKEKIFICFDGALGDSDKANLSLNLTLKTI